MLVLIVLFTSCNGGFTGKHIAEVDFNEKTLVQLNFEENVYNTEIIFQSGELSVVFKGNEGFPDGMKYKVTQESLYMCFMGITKKFPVESFSNGFMPILLYQFIGTYGGVIITENYDKEKGCAYITREFSGDSVSLEVFQNEGNTAYSIYIK